jgi:transcriptional regulator with XRE-family HTH domain
LSQVELADRIGLTFQQVQKYEKGVIRINAGRLQRISEALEIPISYFFPDSAFLATRDQDASAENIFDLSTSGPAQIVRAYRRIESPRARQLLLQIANDLAEEFQAAGDIDEPDIATRLLQIAETAIKSA